MQTGNPPVELEYRENPELGHSTASRHWAKRKSDKVHKKELEIEVLKKRVRS